jgi:hypothetical protein
VKARADLEPERLECIRDGAGALFAIDRSAT